MIVQGQMDKSRSVYNSYKGESLLMASIRSSSSMAFKASAMQWESTMLGKSSKSGEGGWEGSRARSIHGSSCIPPAYQLCQGKMVE